MCNWKSVAFFIITLFISTLTFAQNVAANTDKKDVMESNGKIYVVLVVVLIILSGLIFYVARLDSKISKLEKSEKV